MTETQHEETKKPLSLHQVVKEKIHHGSASILDRAAEIIAEKELVKKVEKVTETHTRLDELSKELSKLKKKPDHVFETIDSKARVEYYNPDTKKKILETEQKIKKIHELLDEYLQEPTNGEKYAKLVDAVK